MTIFYRIRKLLAEVFRDLYEALCSAEEWLEEGDMARDMRSGFGSLARENQARFHKYEQRAVLKS